MTMTTESAADFRKSLVSQRDTAKSMADYYRGQARVAESNVTTQVRLERELNAVIDKFDKAIADEPVQPDPDAPEL